MKKSKCISLFSLGEYQFSLYIKSPINYVGNKSKLINQIVPLFPNNIIRFIDVFGGSGTVLMNTKAESYVYNDINSYIGDIVKGFITAKSADIIIEQVESIISEYNLSMTNKEGFEKLRRDYNSGRNDWLVLYTLMCYSFNHLYRFNTNHEYNASFGSVRAYFSDKQKEDLIALKKRNYKCTFYSLRFQDLFDQLSLNESDFIYFDPPYLGSVGNYNDGKRGFEGWTEQHEIDLLNTLDNLILRNIQFALSNNLKYNNPFLKKWLENHKEAVDIHYLMGNHLNSSYQKLDRSNDIEVLITNYKKENY